MRPPLILGVALCLTASLAAGETRAQDPEALALSWQAPGECPRAAEVRAEIVRLLGGPVRSVSGGRLQVRARVTEGPPWTVRLETESQGSLGERSLQAGSCGELANATALIVALMIDPQAVAARTSPPEAPVANPPAANSARAWDSLIGLVVAGSQGVLPSPDVGVGGSLGVFAARWRLELRASYGLRREQRVEAPVPPGGQGQFGFLSALLAGCYNLGGPGVTWGLCAVGEGGVVSAQGIGVNRTLPAHVPWWALGAGGYAVIPLGRRWAIPLHLDAMLPLQRSEYVFRDAQGNVIASVFKAAPLGVRASAGVELHF